MPAKKLNDTDLTSSFVSIGMNFAAKSKPDADIEATLVSASQLGMDEDDLRVLAVLTTWMGIHFTHVNADRLIRMVKDHSSERVNAYWSAIALWLQKDRRFARMANAYDGKALDLLPTGTSFQVQRKGEDPRFVDSSVRVPNGVLRDRSEDVLAPEILVKRHRGYRNRVMMGANWRADVWTALQQNPKLTASEVARRISCSQAAAWPTCRDFRLLESASSYAR